MLSALPVSRTRLRHHNPLLEVDNTAMASKIKKIFHRNKDDNGEESPKQSHEFNSAQTEPALRTSLYESTAPAATPQTGDYAIRGNENSVVLQPSRKQSVRSSRSRRSSVGYDNVTHRQPTPHRTQPSSSNAAGPGASLPQAFAGLDLGDEQCTFIVSKTRVYKD